ncbi:GntR family transcriptional regulator [Gottfriedia acidiceleris]|uniref:GntR family transcriptional regulator n=1 Tax=Bacillaceae TaxID=186817 RepID=UPI000BEDF476|nr:MULTISPECIES: GntR family transcriptional regulator [unclassified Bacillus (in: firmicutes)]PEC51565.1 GntR family transcriptional regulator [Bacillus sp. AFS096315]PFM78639.1 GntR family transcriptional regulator [Bacillus sp. AFS077874]
MEMETNFLSIREHAYRYLKELILEGHYKPGDRLIERELAVKLNISRTPIREALFRLESQGFVKTVPRKGVIVSNISDEDIMEVFTILSSLEVLAAKLAAKKMTDEIQKEFDQKIKELLYIEEHSDETFENEHIEMNLLLYKAARSPKLFEILSGLTDYIHMSANMGYETPGRRKESLREHIEIMKAVRNKEIEMSEYLTKIHIENSRRAYMNYIEKRKEKTT